MEYFYFRPTPDPTDQSVPPRREALRASFTSCVVLPGHDGKKIAVGVIDGMLCGWRLEEEPDSINFGFYIADLADVPMAEWNPEAKRFELLEEQAPGADWYSA